MKHLLKLTPNCCKWVVGDPRSLTYCGEPVEPGTSWCPAHHKVVFTPPQPRRDRERTNERTSNMWKVREREAR
jgi:hypothetical protein